MEPEILSYPQFERTLRCVAAAFGVETLEAVCEHRRGITFHAEKGVLLVELELTHAGQLRSLLVGNQEQTEGSQLVFKFSDNVEPTDEANKQWFYSNEAPYDDELTRAFYRLGFEDEPVFEYEGVRAELNTLSAHEKLELRLSMPREFWPQKWLDGETAIAT